MRDGIEKAKKTIKQVKTLTLVFVISLLST